MAVVLEVIANCDSISRSESLLSRRVVVLDDGVAYSASVFDLLHVIEEVTSFGCEGQTWQESGAFFSFSCVRSRTFQVSTADACCPRLSDMY